jgi:hypothetical protein
MQQRPDPLGHHDDLDPDEVAELEVLVPDDPGELLTHTGPVRPDVVPPRPAPAEPPSRGPSAAGPAPVPGAAWPGAEPFPFSRQRRLALTALVVAAAVLTAAVSGLMGAAVLPGADGVAGAAPLADPSAPAGTVGGLLPGTELQGVGTVWSLALRPTVLVLVPTSCDGCGRTLLSLQEVADQAGVRLTLVGRPGQEAQLESLSAVVGGLSRTVLLDPDATLVSAYGTEPASGDLTVVLVRADGVVTQVDHNPSFDAPTVQDVHALTPQASTE